MADRVLPDPPATGCAPRRRRRGARLLRVLGPADEESRPHEARFLARVRECRFAIHRRDEASRRTAARAGLVLVDVVPASPEALAMGLELELCPYVAERP
jgi:hypothetical protein